MLEFVLQVPSSKVVVAAVWRLFVGLSGSPSFQVLLADLIWRASVLNLQGALPGSFLLPSLGIVSFLLGFLGISLGIFSLLVGFLVQGSFLGGLLPESCLFLCSPFLGFLGISLGLGSSLPGHNLLLVNSLLPQSSFLGLLLFYRRFFLGGFFLRSLFCSLGLPGSFFL